MKSRGGGRMLDQFKRDAVALYRDTEVYSRCRHSSPATYERNLTTTTLPEAA